MLSEAELRAVVDRLPRVRFALGYGSGVVPQGAAAATTQPMRDLIVAVDDPAAFHHLNLAMNRDHYSALGYLGGSFVSTVQEWGAGVYFNPYVHINGQLVKYGVISHARLVSDLQNWDSLYVSGRMQKPFRHIIDDEAITEASKINLQGALCASLLSLPEEFSEQQLWTSITQLSYQGDFRMRFGENPHKIASIVTPDNIPRFRQMYHGQMQQLHSVLREKQPGMFEQDCSATSRIFLFHGLPLTIQSRVLRRGTGSVSPHALAMGVGCQLNHIVKRSSRNQAIKGIFTAGLTKTVVYASAKIKKMYTAKR